VFAVSGATTSTSASARCGYGSAGSVFRASAQKVSAATKRSAPRVVIGLTSAAFASAGIFGYRDHPFVLGGVICAALIVNHLLACISGAAIPFIMKGLGFDPAQSATIFATTVTDCCGFFATLGIAQLCMPWLKSVAA